MVPAQPKRIVRDGYDKVSHAYRGDHVDGGNETVARYREWIGELSPLIPPGRLYSTSVAATAFRNAGCWSMPGLQ